MADQNYKGLVQVYTGDGKGKTTAALGLALRASGQGLKVIFIQFLKGQLCGEHLFAQKHGTFEIHQFGEGDLFNKSDSELLKEIQDAYEYAEEAITGSKYDMVILDEIFVAHWRGLISLQQILSLIDKNPGNLELVLTGRKAPPEVIKRADLVTEMLMIKHPFFQGIPQRKGIEY
ncbi:MAG: cob(I)yrinic acid a,c-diamide adenosyltransferase [Dehalococcoidia bacterium]|nr:cob(I)yrinic acid a,c-diamide adenosyltransferase [Dehalococcoidia bacterium]